MANRRKNAINERELIALKMMAQGKEGDEIAEVLGIRHDTFNTMMARLRKRLGCSNTNVMMFRFGQLSERRNGNVVVED